MNTELVISDDKSTSIERVIATGDLSKLTPAERVRYYREICNSIGLNPLSQPFSYIVLSGKLTLYARKDATDQLRRIHGISITDLVSETVSDVYCVTAHAMTRDGRTDQDTGAVYIGTLKGEALANAIMKARTKAKRRVTLSIAGLGWLDETEVDSIPGAQPVVVAETGEILDVTPKVLPHAEQDFGMSPAEPAAPSVASNGTTPAEKLTAWCTNAHRNSRGPCTPDTYGYLVGVIDAICDGADAHKRILSRLTGSDISRDNRPGLDLASNLLRWLPETLTVAAGGGPNPQYKPEYVAVIQRLWRDLTGQLELSV